MTATVDQVARSIERMRVAASARVEARARTRRLVATWLAVGFVVSLIIALVALAPVSWRAWASSYLTDGLGEGAVPGDGADATVLSVTAGAVVTAWTVEVADERAYLLATVQVRLENVVEPVIDVRARWLTPPSDVPTEAMAWPHDATPLSQTTPLPTVFTHGGSAEFGTGQRCSVAQYSEGSVMAWCDVDVVVDLGREANPVLPQSLLIIDQDSGEAVADLVLERATWRWDACDLGRCSAVP